MSASELERLGIDPAAVEAALDADLTFPARWYSDPAIYDFELDSIFTRSWVIAGPLDRLANPGDHIVCRAAHVPILVTRGRDGELRGFVNVCRHRAYPVATEDGCRQLLQCAYHAWTYELDGSLNRAPRAEAEPGFDKADFSLVPVAVDTWGPLVWVNPDPNAPPLREAYPGFEPMAQEHGMDFSGYVYHSRSSYDVPANWKVWVENASECYHCPTIHRESFADAWNVDHGTYQYMNQDRLLGQFTVPNPKAREFGNATGEFRYIFVWPSSFIVMDEHVAFPGIITPTGPETCVSHSHFYAREGLDSEFVAGWVEMYDKTLREDADAVRVQQPGLRSRLVPNGRLMPASESAISRFHRMVWESFKESLGVAAGEPG